jgi:hypothetical protein
VSHLAHFGDVDEDVMAIMDSHLERQPPADTLFLNLSYICHGPVWANDRFHKEVVITNKRRVHTRASHYSEEKAFFLLEVKLVASHASWIGLVSSVFW